MVRILGAWSLVLAALATQLVDADDCHKGL